MVTHEVQDSVLDFLFHGALHPEEVGIYKRKISRKKKENTLSFKKIS